MKFYIRNKQAFPFYAPLTYVPLARSGFNGMYRLVCLITLLATTLPAMAATSYISDELRVPLRKTPCSRCAIVHRGLKAGLKLNVIEAKDGWSHITTPSGLEGWLESQYLTPEPIARTQVVQLRKQNASFREENQQMSGALDAAQQEATELKAQLASLQEENIDTSSRLTEIREVSANAINLHTQNQELLKQNTMLQSEIDLLKATTAQMANNNTQKWFFYGALAVFMGALLSILLPRLKRKRRGFSEWA
ncbi:MAG: TIGR04211 family SH3 domain-containing protein [Gammaproteobacteria bacterium]|nr:MAG: TIGR04211 family SH3 domain-containing protein [Gammaproteobacteria bacterium]